MKIIFEIDDDLLHEIRQATGEQEDSAAVKIALDTFVSDVHRRAFVESVMRGEIDYSMTNDELEAMLEEGSDKRFDLS